MLLGILGFCKANSYPYNAQKPLGSLAERPVG
jgi:hypothetical protein